jgi:hypothetical protein
MKRTTLFQMIATLTYGVIICLWAGIDAYLNNHGHAKLIGNGLGNDLAAFVVKYILGFVAILYLWFEGDPPYKWRTFLTFVIFAVIAWTCTDLIYNLIREGVGLDHVGTTSFLDRLYQKTGNPFAWMTLTKVLLLTGAIVFYKIDQKNEKLE